ncbi:MAG: hypothetical protein FWE98_06955 [Oscillospiraceae bacterium]|nr:hypothetical protein [Oscillospiraceae bacterium]
MVIRFSRAARFFCACALLLLTALISIGTRSVSVSTPYDFRGRALPVVIYRNLNDGGPASLTLEDLRADIAWLAEQGYEALSERDLVAALRREFPLPAAPVLLLFEDGAERFEADVLPILREAGLNWFSVGKSALLANELRAAGYPVTRIERVAGFTVGEQVNA